MKIIEILHQNNENHETSIIQCQSNENHINLIVPRQKNYENQENLFIPRENHENHEILRIPSQNLRIQCQNNEIMKIYCFFIRIITIMKFL